MLSLKFVKQSSYLQDLAGCLATVLTTSDRDVRQVVQSYSEVFPLEQTELAALYWLTLLDLIEGCLQLETSSQLGPDFQSQIFDQTLISCSKAFEKLFYQGDLFE